MTVCDDCGRLPLPLDDLHELVVTDELTGEVLARDYYVCADCWEGDL
jgi:hypothetical protein